MYIYIYIHAHLFNHIFIFDTPDLYSSITDDDEEPRCKVAYLDLDEGAEENTNWIKRAGKAKVIYPNGHSFEGKEIHNLFFSLSICCLFD